MLFEEADLVQKEPGWIFQTQLSRQQAHSNLKINGLCQMRPSVDYRHQTVMDRKECGHPLLHKDMDKKDFPEIGRFCLLRYYINLKNLDRDLLDNFQAYFPCSPETYFKLAEDEWRTDSHDSFVQRIIKHTFCKRVKEKKFVSLFKNKSTLRALLSIHSVPQRQNNTVVTLF